MLWTVFLYPTGLRILVTLLLDTLPMLGNVLLLCFFVFFIFGIVGVQLWSGLLRNRCFLELPPNISTGGCVSFKAEIFYYSDNTNFTWNSYLWHVALYELVSVQNSSLLKVHLWLWFNWSHCHTWICTICLYMLYYFTRWWFSSIDDGIIVFA